MTVNDEEQPIPPPEEDLQPMTLRRYSNDPETLARVLDRLRE